MLPGVVVWSWPVTSSPLAWSQDLSGEAAAAGCLGALATPQALLLRCLYMDHVSWAASCVDVCARPVLWRCPGDLSSPRAAVLHGVGCGPLWWCGVGRGDRVVGAWHGRLWGGLWRRVSWTGQLLLVGTCPAAVLAASAVCGRLLAWHWPARGVVYGRVGGCRRNGGCLGSWCCCSVLQQHPGACPAACLCFISAAGPYPTLLVSFRETGCCPAGNMHMPLVCLVVCNVQ